MSITEILERANNGDSDAMMEACFYYYEQKDFDEAAKWAESAAEAGDERAPRMICALRSILGLAYCGIGAFDEALEEWSLVKKWATYSLQKQQLNDEGRTIATGHLEDAEYYAAFCYYCKGMYQESVTVNNLSGTRATILRGLCIDKLALETNNSSLLSTAFQVLNCIVRDGAYFSSEKGEFEEQIFCLAVNSLAVSYTLGLNGFLNKDLNRAVWLLESALQTVKIPKHRTFLQSRLSKYQKTMFGDYRYIE